MAELPDVLKLGHPKLDLDHLKVIEELEAVRAGKHPNLELLWNHFRDHFRAEESFMVETGYPGFRAHRDEHESSLLFFDHLRAIYFMNESKEALEKLVDALTHWLSHHVMYVDVLFAEYLRTKSTPK
jgi:hemerythrin-like metal-binding protein